MAGFVLYYKYIKNGSQSYHYSKSHINTGLFKQFNLIASQMIDINTFKGRTSKRRGKEGINTISVPARPTISHRHWF